MSDVIADPEKAPVDSPPVARINLAELDDKHLGRYRHPNERRALVAIAIGMAATLFALWIARPFLGNILDFLPGPIFGFLDKWLHPTRLGLVVLAVLALTAVFDAIGQWTRAWQLVAQAVEVTPTTFPQLAPVVDELRTRFDLPKTRVYVSRDAPANGYTIGVREPFAIVFSSAGVGTLTPEEFKFCLGREMGSIKLGHTRMATLLGNVNMSLPQPMSFLLKFRSVIFGTYHHAQALSCDRIGVVATRDVGPALSTLVKQNLGTVRGAKIDVKSLTPQTAALQRGASGAVLRAAMVFNAQPFAVARLAELVAWTGESGEETAAAPARPQAAAPAPASPAPTGPAPADPTTPTPASPGDTASATPPASPSTTASDSPSATTAPAPATPGSRARPRRRRLPPRLQRARAPWRRHPAIPEWLPRMLPRRRPLQHPRPSRPARAPRRRHQRRLLRVGRSASPPHDRLMRNDATREGHCDRRQRGTHCPADS
jgi:Zn-dependent protease with chaperone function